MFHRTYLGPIALAGALLGTSVAAFAQGQAPAPVAPAASATTGPAMNGHHHRRGGWRAALEGLTLTADQKTKIDSIMRADQEAYRAGGNDQSPEARMAARAKMRTDVENVLTPDQKTQFEATLKYHRSPTTSPAS